MTLIMIALIVVFGIFMSTRLVGYEIYQGKTVIEDTEIEVLIDTSDEDFIFKAHPLSNPANWVVLHGTREKDGKTLVFTFTDAGSYEDMSECHALRYIKEGKKLHLDSDAPEWIPKEMHKISHKKYEELIDSYKPFQ